MMVHPLVALDIGSTKVACAIGQPHEHAPGFELLGASLVPYPACPEAWLGDLLMVSRTIEQALEATAVRGDFDRALVAVNHPRLTSERATVAVPLGDEPITVRTQDLSRLQAGALNQVLGVDREPLLVERLGCSGNGFENVRDPRGLSATRLLGTYHVLTMPMAARRALVQAVESAGLEVAGLAYTMPALLAGAGDDELYSRRVLVMDVGGLTTDVGLFADGILRAARIVPWGGLTLATAIAKELGVTMDQALTWSLEGTSCRKPDVRTLIEDGWRALQQAAEALLEAEPKPDAALVCGRGALMDGFAEWMERAIAVPVSVARSPRVTRAGDLSRQVGLSAAIGTLELACRASNGLAHKPAPKFINRLIERTRTILTEYF